MTPTPTGSSSGAYSDKWGYNYYVMQDAQNGTECAKTYRMIYDGIMAYRYNKGNVTISLGNPCLCNSSDYSAVWDVIDKIYYAVYCDNPQLVWVQSGMSTGWSQYGGEVNYTISPYFFSLSDYDFDALYAECTAARDEIASQITTQYGENATKIQKVKVVHDYLILHKDYCDEVAENPYYSGPEVVFSQNMLGMFATGQEPVCMSYATAFKWLCNSFGIQCETVSSSGHAWNIVNYGETVDYSNPNADYHSNTWYEMDVTWDDPVNMGGTYIGYGYFNLTSSEMSAISSHTKNNQYYPAYPTTCTGTDLSYTNCINNNIFN